MIGILKKHYKSPFPELNVKRRDEPVVIYTVYSDTPTVDNGYKWAHIFVGTNTMFTDVYGMQTNSQSVNTLDDCIRDRGAISQLVSDFAQVEISKRLLHLLWALYIGNW